MSNFEGSRSSRLTAHPLCLLSLTALASGVFDTGCGSSDPAAGGSVQAAAGASASAGSNNGASGASGKGGSGGAGTSTNGGSSGPGSGAGTAGASTAGGPGASAGGGNAVDPALDQACTVQCTKQSALACVATPCHDACVNKASDSPSKNYNCKTQFTSMVQCTSKLTVAEWQCSPDDGAAVPVAGQCTTEVCAWTCCATDIVAPTDLWGRCNAGCPE